MNRREPFLNICHQMTDDLYYGEERYGFAQSRNVR